MLHWVKPAKHSAQGPVYSLPIPPTRQRKYVLLSDVRCKIFNHEIGTHLQYVGCWQTPPNPHPLASHRLSFHRLRNHFKKASVKDCHFS